MNLFEAIIDAASETSSGIPSSTTVPTINEYVRWANIGQNIIAEQTDVIDKTITFPTVAKQKVYDPGVSLVRPRRVEFLNSNSWVPLEYLSLDDFRATRGPNTTTGTPVCYTVWDNKIEIYPAYGTAATTFVVSGTQAATVTTINVVSTTGAPSGGGRLYNATTGEKIDYTGLTATSFTGCTRGVEGTVAAALTGTTDSLTIMNLQVHATVRYLIRPYSIYTTGTAVFTNASATVTGTSTYFSTNVYKDWEIGTGTNPSKWYTVSSASAAATITLTGLYGEATVNPTTYYVASPPLDIPQQYQPILTDYLVYRTLLRLERTDEANLKRQEMDRKIDDLRVETTHRGDKYYRG
jgi:hypothetical protein